MLVNFGGQTFILIGTMNNFNQNLPHWCLIVKELELNYSVIKRRADSGESIKNTRKIADWLWEKA